MKWKAYTFWPEVSSKELVLCEKYGAPMMRTFHILFSQLYEFRKARGTVWGPTPVTVFMHVSQNGGNVFQCLEGKSLTEGDQPAQR
jgi:hypothetical protein